MLPAFLRAISFVLGLARLAAQMLAMAGIIRTVDIIFARLAAVIAGAHDNVLVRMVDRNRDPFVEHIAAAIEQPALRNRVFAICYDAAVQLIYILEAFLAHDGGQHLAPDSPVQYVRMVLSLCCSILSRSQSGIPGSCPRPDESRSGNGPDHTHSRSARPAR